MSGIGSLSLSLRRRRIGMTFQVHDENIRTPHAIAYLRQLHRELRRPLIVVMDRLSVHRAAVGELRQSGAPWLHVEWLPPYASDLNPVAAIWCPSKYSQQANFVPDNVEHLRDAVIESVGDLQADDRLRRSFFQTAELPP